MRVSNIANFLGGANNVQAVSMLRGEQRTVVGTCSVVTTDSEGNETKVAQDISTWDIEAKPIYATADVVTTSSDVTITNVVQGTVTNGLTELDVSISDGPNGKFSLLIPKNLYPTAIEVDATNIPVIIVYVSIANGAKPTGNAEDTRTIRQFRYLVLMREGQGVDNA